MKRLFVCLLALFMSAHAGEMYSYEYNISSGNTDKVFQDLIKWAESQSGYFTHMRNDFISFNLPKGTLQAFKDTLARVSEITGEQYYSRDLSFAMERLNLRLQTRRELMEKFVEMVKGSSLEQLLSLEREIANLTAEIEGLEGQKKMLEAQTSMVSVTVRSRQTVKPLREEYRSPFYWINELDLENMQRAF